MKLQVKIAMYNAFSKAIIIIGIGLFLPVIVSQEAYNHADNRLMARKAKAMSMLKHHELDEIIHDQDCTFDDYNIFKEEYISISPVAKLTPDFGKEKIENVAMNIENEVVKHRVLSQGFIYDNQLYNLQIGEGLKTIEQFNISLRAFTIKVLIIVILLSIFFDLGFSRILLQPFNRIIKAKLKDVTHPSSFQFTKIKTSTTEFAYLDSSINEMMIKIKEAFDIEKEFISNVSHELLTPISILHSRIENIIADERVLEDVRLKMVESEKTLIRLSKIIKTLLYISKIENEQYLKNESCSLKTIIGDVAGEIEERLTDKNITLTQEWKEDFIQQSSNSSLLHTMFFNIINNAIKYNKQDGQIKIKGYKGERDFVVSIEDTGIGINPLDIAKIFDRFKRFQNEDGKSFGLGLPIVKTISNFLNIKREVQSEKDSGTIFILRFPLI